MQRGLEGREPVQRGLEGRPCRRTGGEREEDWRREPCREGLEEGESRAGEDWGREPCREDWRESRAGRTRGRAVQGGTGGERAVQGGLGERAVQRAASSGDLQRFFS